MPFAHVQDNPVSQRTQPPFFHSIEFSLESVCALQLGPGDRRHYKKTTLTYLRGYAVDETPVHADLEPPPEMTEGNLTEQPSTSANSASHDVSKGPKWLQNDKKVSLCLFCCLFLANAPLLEPMGSRNDIVCGIAGTAHCKLQEEELFSFESECSMVLYEGCDWAGIALVWLLQRSSARESP